jgi:hypothetical protein
VCVGVRVDVTVDVRGGEELKVGEVETEPMKDTEGVEVTPVV